LRPLPEIHDVNASMTEQPSPERNFEVARDLRSMPSAFRGAVVAIGNFDGVHRGHRAVIAAATNRARILGCRAIALTFEPHTRSYFRPDEPLFRLTDEAAKLRLLAATALDGALVLTFDASVAELSADAFVQQALVDGLAVAGAAVGFDFHFGRGREGSPAVLAAAGARHGFPVDIVAPLRDGGRPVSSSGIRAALAEGRVDDAADMLGYPWFATGAVIHGEKRGRDLGFPTANLRLDPACALRHGIYAVRVGRGAERFDGVASFGRRPTFDNGAPLLEVFLFDFAGDLYGQVLDVALVGWIRPELRFSSVDDLVRQMRDDSARARELLAQAPDAFPVFGMPAARG
jgi:riboflavin kinase / FMN adenylyltransferase